MKVALTRWLVLGRVGLLPFLIDAVFVVLVLGLVHAAFGRRSAVPLLVMDAVLSFVMFSTVLYALYYEQLITPDVVTFAGQVDEVRESVVALLAPIQLLFVFDLPLLAGWLIASGTPAPAETHRRVPLVAAMGAAAFVCIAAVAAAVAVPGQADSLTMGRTRGIFAYQIASLIRDEEANLTRGVTSAVAAAEQAKSLPEQVAELQGSSEAERLAGAPAPGSAAGLDLIVVQFEALQTVCIDTTIDGVEVTPNLNELAHESWYFPNTYAQIGKGNTSDAEFVGNAALYPPVEQAASVAYGKKIVPALPRLLDAMGYAAVTLHTNKVTYWNRDQLYPALGFTRYYDAPYFKGEDVLGMGSTDFVLFKRTLRELERISAEGKHYYANVITVTSHNPFKRLSKVRQKWYPGAPYGGTFAGDYLSRINYSDRAFGEFVAGLKESGAWDRSIVMVYGDHFGLKLPGPGEDAYAKALEALYGHPYTILDRLTVPLMIHVPGQAEQRLVEEPVGQADVFPTAADLMGLDVSGIPVFGTSVFMRTSRLIPIPRFAGTGAFINDRVLFTPNPDPAAATAIALETHAPVEPTEEDRRDAATANELYALSLAYASALPERSGVETATSVRE